jgi:hypothetical protein
MNEFVNVEPLLTIELLTCASQIYSTENRGGGSILGRKWDKRKTKKLADKVRSASNRCRNGIGS